MQMKDKFRQCMVYLYPGGLSDMSCREQWRDLVRAFSMGWLEALMASHNTAAVEAAMSTYGVISSPGWYPDDSWDWTPLCKFNAN